jgi:uncharacterized protein
MARCVDARRATILGDAVKQHLDALASGIVSARIGAILPGRHGATTMTPPMLLTVIDARLAVCRLEPADRIPAWIDRAGDFVSITRTPDELSIVCDTDVVPRGVPMEGPWRAFKVQGPLVMTLIGVVAALAKPLADAGISIFAMSTYDTDYVLVHEPDLDAAVDALTTAGYSIQPTSMSG